ncbi:MAG: TIGR01777 family oxidoreductase [Myxococcaceae bacterium]
MKTLLTGATGLIGQKLLERLGPSIVLSRNPERARRSMGGAEVAAWDPEAGPPRPEVFEGVDVIFHLAGEPVGEGRWTQERKRRIRDSRVVGTRNLVAGLARLTQRPRVLVCASAVGFYGNRGDELLDERSPAGSGFLADVCVEWEREAQAARPLGMRVVLVRTGLVLSPDGGALAKMLTPFRLGAGGRLGDGRQWMPWIHVEDEVGLLLHAMNDERVEGALNAVAPRPVTNRDFTEALGHAVHRPALLPVPKTALRLAFGEMSEILLVSQRALPKEAERTGYAFKYPELRQALDAMVHHREVA